MALNRTELFKYVQEDIKKYEGIRRPLKASIAERATVRKMWLTKLHPNPEDEFTWPKVGPKDEIIEDYKQQLLDPTNPLPPLLVEKMFPDGYTILNGHHRWAAAMLMGFSTISVKVVNMTHEEDILRQMDASKRVMRASFDLDEVLLAGPETEEEDPPHFPLNLICKDRLRLGVPSLFKELHRLGFDVWVYSHTANAEERVRALFRAYGDEPDVYINGIGSVVSGRPNSLKPAEAFNGRYEFTVHIDTESMLFSRPKTKDFDEVELTGEDEDWALSVMREIEKRSNPLNHYWDK